MDSTEKPFTCVEWCAGYAGIHLGLKRVIPNLRTVAYGEIEAFAVANLVAKMEAGLLDAAPVWTDIKTFPVEPFRDKVDLLVAGYPCQPFSAAGKRAGEDDPRHLWPWIRKAIGIIRPRYCFFENVEGHISLGLSTVISDLEEDGYRTTWGIFSAAEVGAPHQRKRVFILAHDEHDGQSSRAASGGVCGEEQDARGQEEPCFIEQPKRSGSQPCVYDKEVGNPASLRLRESGEDTGEVATDTHGEERRVHEPSGAGALSRHESQQEAVSDCIWPSRPGEEQHCWEPPRVVDSQSKRTDRAAGEGGGTAEGSGGALSRQPEWSDSGSEGVENTTSADRGRTSGGVSCASVREPGAGGLEETGQGMGNASKQGQPQRGAGEVGESTGAQSEPERSDSPYSGDTECEAEPPLGGNFARTPHRLDNAELYESCDNRTDELRLLGNGVVVATASKAWTVLSGRLK